MFVGGPVIVLDGLDDVGLDVLGLLEHEVSAGGELAVLVVGETGARVGGLAGLGDFLGEVELEDGGCQVSEHPGIYFMIIKSPVENKQLLLRSHSLGCLPDTTSPPGTASC